MRCFTPELYVALQSCDSPAAARETNVRWEEALRRYRERLAVLKTQPDLPPGVRQVLEFGGSLHDAQVVVLARDRDRRPIAAPTAPLVLVLQPENRTESLVLTYSLVEEPRVIQAIFPPEDRALPRLWLYDELERDAGVDWKMPVYGHSILFSDGVEVQVRFHHLEVAELAPILPGELPGQPADDVLSASV